MFDLGRNSVVDSPESTDDGLGEPIIRGQLLHEMQLVDILDTTFSLYRSDFWLFIGIAAVLHIPFGII